MTDGPLHIETETINGRVLNCTTSIDGSIVVEEKNTCMQSISKPYLKYGSGPNDFIKYGSGPDDYIKFKTK